MEARNRRKPVRPKQPDRTLGVALLSAGAAALGIGAAVAALVLRRRIKPADGHLAPDLAPDATIPPVTTAPSNATADTAASPPQERAPEHFRPDPTAVPSADEREALRPATGPAPTLAADRGSIGGDPQSAA